MVEQVRRSVACRVCGGDTPSCSGSVTVWHRHTDLQLQSDGAAPSRSTASSSVTVGLGRVATGPQHDGRVRRVQLHDGGARKSGFYPPWVTPVGKINSRGQD